VLGGRIGIFVATMTGLAELCAQEVRDVIAASGQTADLKLMDGLGAEAIDPYDLLVIVSSTYGHGDIPDNGQAFFRALEGKESLEGKRFAVFGLGDRTYADTFCHAGEKWDSLLAGKGAARLIALQIHDASSGTLAEDAARSWAEGWVSQLAEAA